MDAVTYVLSYAVCSPSSSAISEGCTNLYRSAFAETHRVCQIGVYAAFFCVDLYQAKVVPHSLDQVVQTVKREQPV